MAKVPYSKLNCKLNTEIKTIELAGVAVEVRQYLPINEKLALIGRVIELAHDQDYNFSNPVKAAAIRDVEAVIAYTNINFTEKQKEDYAKLYDQMHSTGALDVIIEAIPENEWLEIVYAVTDSIEAIYKYQNSALGILDSIKTDYSDMNIDLTKIQEQISDPNSIPLLKDILTKLG